MTINQVIAHLRMLEFKHRPHANNYFHEKRINNYLISITISKKRMHIWSSLATESGKLEEQKSVRTGHTNGLNFLARHLYEIDQGISKNEKSNNSRYIRRAKH